MGQKSTSLQADGRAGRDLCRNSAKVFKEIAIFATSCRKTQSASVKTQSASVKTQSASLQDDRRLKAMQGESPKIGQKIGQKIRFQS